MPILRKAGKGTGFDHHAAEQQPVQDIVFRVFQELRFLLRVEPRQTVQQHLQNFQLVVQKARRIVTVNAVAGEKAVNRAVQTLFSVVQEEAEAQQLRENDRLCFSVLSNYARVLRRWKVQYAAKAPDKRFVEACHKLDEAEYYLDILCAGDSHERAEVVSYLLVDGRLDKLKETINGRDKTTYDETYQESANLRINLAEQLSKLPLSYFSKHNLSDLAQTIMADVASIEHAFANAVANSIGFAIYFLVISVALLIMNWKLGLCVLLPVLTSASVLFLTKKLQVRDVNKHYSSS